MLGLEFCGVTTSLLVKFLHDNRSIDMTIEWPDI